MNQQFQGQTIEDALREAIATLGEDLQIIDAQRVRRRRGLRRRREHFEVTACPGAAEPKDFEDVLRAMVDRVDDAEQAVGVDLADTDVSWWRSAEFVLPDDTKGVGPSFGERPQTAASGPRGGGDVEVDVRPAAVTTRPIDGGTPLDANINPRGGVGVLVKEPVVATIAPVVASRWSREALLELGLPSALIGRVHVPEGAADLEWVAALAKAIGELLETAESMSGPCDLTGHGAASVVHLLRGACEGFRLDSLIIDGQRVQATALELALAVRSLIQSSP